MKPLSIGFKKLLSSRGWLLLFALVLAICAQVAQSRITSKNGVKSAVYLSPKLTLEPGSVANKYFYNIDFPKGHIAIKSFNAEVVDDRGTPVPLHETYVHHWVTVRYYIRQGVEGPEYNANFDFHQSDFLDAGNSGVCKHGLSQFWGVGSETRKTLTDVPDPFGIEVGNPAEIPEGYEEKWLFNVHAIDTRGAEDRLGCTECRCDLYNVTVDKYGQALNPNYEGGLFCCYDKTKCKVKEGFQIIKRTLYMRYTVKWIDWDNSIVPVKIYMFDVTDTWKKADGSTGLHDCQIEYDVELCSNGVARDGCFDNKRVTLTAPSSGNIIYGVGHQHTGGVGIALYGEDGRVLCSSIPVYGQGNEAGNEAGYIVGMSTCYPQPGTVKMSKGEAIVVESIYSSAQKHTGVMGHFYILVAEPASGNDSHLSASTPIHNKPSIASYVWIQVMFGVVISAAIAAIVVFTYRGRSPKDDGYEPIVM